MTDFQQGMCLGAIIVALALVFTSRRATVKREYIDTRGIVPETIVLGEARRVIPDAAAEIVIDAQRSRILITDRRRMVMAIYQLGGPTHDPRPEGEQ